MTGRIAGTSYFSVVIEYPGIFLAYQGKTNLIKNVSSVSGIFSKKISGNLREWRYYVTTVCRDSGHKNTPEWRESGMSVQVKFATPAGSVSLDLSRISAFEITRLRTTFELVALTPENPQKNTPYVIATRGWEWQIREIADALQKLKAEKGDIIFEITDSDSHLVKNIS